MAGTRIIPASGKLGMVLLDSLQGAISEVFADGWGLSLQVDTARIPHFDMIVDDYGLYWPAVLVGFAGGTGTITAKFDLNPHGALMSDPNLWMGGTGIAFLGYTALVGFVVEFTITNVAAAQNVNNTEGGSYEMSIDITGADFTTTGP